MIDNIWVSIRQLVIILFICILAACTSKESNSIIGSWSECQRDRIYKEFKITENYTTTSLSDFQQHDFDDGISFFKSSIQDSFLIVSKGLNVHLINPPETLRFQFTSSDEVMLKNSYGVSYLKRLNNEIPDIDSTNLSGWSKSYLDEFLKRAQLADCPDLRTEEEKAPPPELPPVEDDFEELAVIDALPERIETKYSKYRQNFERSYQLVPSFFEHDFTGDGSLDAAIFIIEKSSNKQGILFILGGDDSVFIVGAGNSFGPGGDNFEWADYWEIFNQRLTYETTFLGNGDVDENQEVKLNHAALSIREDEGSGGLIYFSNDKFIWIHQGD
ncbi:MAG: hypothetical protein AAFN93_24365 [Bacteroidota bacterium]